ncbi:MAG TPA: hypothetical protein VEC11_00915 [Allosphingosinicella sp.]|nr:hypothetical protein [Allosphingosinicella sp.]
MSLAALMLVLQVDPVGPPLDAQTVSEGFQTICVRHVTDPAALRAALRRSPLRFVRAANEGRFEVYRAGGATVRFEPGTGCAFDARLASRSEADRAIAQVSRTNRRPIPPGAVNHPGTAARYRWEPEAASRVGLAASIDWGRLGAPDRTPATISLWAYRRSEP